MLAVRAGFSPWLADLFLGDHRLRGGAVRHDRAPRVGSRRRAVGSDRSRVAPHPDVGVAVQHDRAPGPWAPGFGWPSSSSTRPSASPCGPPTPASRIWWPTRRPPTSCSTPAGWSEPRSAPGSAASIDPEAVGIGVLFPLLFLGLAAPMIKSRKDLARGRRSSGGLGRRHCCPCPPPGRSQSPRWWRPWPGCSSVSDLALVLAVAAITYGTRVAFLLRPRPAPEGALGRFLDVFPLALFVAIAMHRAGGPGRGARASPLPWPPLWVVSSAPSSSGGTCGASWRSGWFSSTSHGQ